jgi:hypothetical protein
VEVGTLQERPKFKTKWKPNGMTTLSKAISINAHLISDEEQVTD